MLRACVCLLLLVAGLFGSAHAQAPAESSLSGTVKDVEGVGKSGVQVKVFIDGFAQGQAMTGADGAYSLTYRFDPAADASIVVWYLPPSGYVPELVVLRESTRAREMGLWSPCVVRAPFAPSLTHDAIVYTESGKFDALSESGCL